MTNLNNLMILISTFYVLIGIFISYRVCGKTHFLVRFALMLPLISSVFTVIAILNGDYIAYLVDIIRELCFVGVYLFLAVLLTGKRLLKNIDNNKYNLERC